MFRVYKDFLQRVLLICLHYQELGYDLSSTRNYVNQHWYERRYNGVEPEKADSIRNSLGFLDSEEFTVKGHSCLDMVLLIGKQLKGGEPRDRDLIDTIVKAVSLPYAKNSFAGSTIQYLREAILIPEEIAALKLSLQKEMSCTLCGHKFIRGEMSTAMINGNDKSFICTRCTKPSFLASDTDIQGHVTVKSVKGLDGLLQKKHTSAPVPEEPPLDIIQYAPIAGGAAADVAVVGDVQRQMYQILQPPPAAAGVANIWFDDQANQAGALGEFPQWRIDPVPPRRR